LPTTYRDLVTALRRLEIDHYQPVIAHASLSAFGNVNGGAETMVGALLSTYHSLIMPTFTYRCMLIPESGPPDNGIEYGSGKDHNLMAEFFRHDMPADRLMGIIPETLRNHPKASRSNHPLLSFAGVNADLALKAQALSAPLAPIQVLTESKGWVLLLGVDHTVNTGIHLGEKLAGRKQFIRWALTPQGVVECPGFPGCSEGFQALAPHVESISRRAALGEAQIQAFPLAEMISIVKSVISKDPLALLCDRSYCERCQTIKKEIGEAGEA
jgi:aminoglycoside 3-N-acetyltransferase